MVTYSPVPGVDTTDTRVPNDGKDHTFVLGTVPDDMPGESKYAYLNINLYTPRYDYIYFSPNFHVMWTITPYNKIPS